MAAWVWQGCHTLLWLHLRRPMRMSASTDADVCADRYGCLRRPMQMSAPTDADVCVDRCESCREDFLALASGKAERSPSLTTLLVLPYRNNQQCIIPKKAVRHSCHTAFYIYKYRLNGNVGVIFLQGQGEPCMVLLSTEKKNQYEKHSPLNYHNKRNFVHQNHDYDQNHYYNILMSNKVSE